MRGAPDWTELTNYGDEVIPLGWKLEAYALDSARWREAFLERLAEVGYLGLVEASTRVYDLLIEPKEFHCALVRPDHLARQSEE